MSVCVFLRFLYPLSLHTQLAPLGVSGWGGICATLLDYGQDALEAAQTNCISRGVGGAAAAGRR